MWNFEVYIDIKSTSIGHKLLEISLMENAPHSDVGYSASGR